MTEQAISIQKKIFDIDAFSKTRVHELQNRVSNLVNYRLQKRMEDYFEEIIPEEILLKVECLQINIGTVNWAGLEDEIEQRLMSGLAEEFSGMLQLLDSERGDTYPGITVEPTSQGKLHFFSYYLVNGSVPWYAGSKKKYDIDELFEELYMQNPGEIKAIILKEGKKINTRRRIAYQFEEASVQKVVHIVEPAASEYILNTQKKILEVQQEKQIVRASEKEFGNSLWLFILNYLFGEMSSRFEEKMFIKSSLAQLAAHYNLNYRQLLHSFHDVLNNVKREDTFQPLTKAVNELFIDESNTLPEEHIPEIKPGSKADDSLSLTKAIGLLQNYLFNGTLPIQYEQMQRSDMRHLLLNAVKTAPVTLRNILFLLSRQGNGIKNLFKIIDDKDNEVLARVLMKDHEKMIVDVVEIFLELHGFKPLCNLSQQELKFEIWENLLKYFLKQTRTDFNIFEMADGLVGFIARISGTEKMKVLESLKSSFQKKQSLSPESTVARDLFEEILEIAAPESLSYLDNEEVTHLKKSSSEHPAQSDPFYHQSQLANLVHYLLTYGAMPWWGQEFYHMPLQQLLNDLYEQDFVSLQLIFRKAATSAPMRARLLQHIPITILKELLFQLPNGDIINVSSSEFLHILNKSKLVQYYASEFVERIIFAIAWEINANSGYNLFSKLLFYDESINQFSRILKINREDFIRTLLHTIKKEDENGLSIMKTNLQVLQLNVQRKHLQGGDEYDDKGIEYHGETHNKAEGDNELAEAKRILNEFIPTEMADVELYNQLTDLLQYFLQWNRLPDAYSKADKHQQRELLRQTVKILFLINPRQLQLLIKTTTSSVVSTAYLAELFIEEEGGKQKQIAQFLFDSLEKMTGENKRGIETGGEIQARSPQNKSLELANIFDAEEISMSSSQEDRTLNETKRVLEFFLKNNRLPSDMIKFSSELYDLHYLLISHLFEKDQFFLGELFKRPGNSMEAKLFLYDLLAMHNGPVSGRLEVVIKNVMEEDLKDTFFKETGIKGSIYENDFHELVTRRVAEIKFGAFQEKRDAYLSSPAFSKMILEQFGEAAFLDLPSAKAHYENIPNDIVNWWYSFLRDAISEEWLRERVMKLFYHFNILFLSGRMNIHTAENYTHTFINYVAEKSHLDSIPLLKKILEHAMKKKRDQEEKFAEQNTLIIQKAPALIIKQEEAVILKRTLQSEEDKKFAANSRSHGIISETELIKSIQNEVWGQKSDEGEGDERNSRLVVENGESIYVSNAGLVLFHPFLETYFSRTGLMGNNIFIDDECRNRAVLLLQYLATGAIAFEEHELVLNKILCNVPLEEAIPTSFEVTENEIDITRELLEVIIERWDKMKNTSPEGFQHSFIMREGVMNFKEDYWNLKVEQRGYDILLQTLPWAFGYIKMSWMQHNLIVEWI